MALFSDKYHSLLRTVLAAVLAIVLACAFVPAPALAEPQQGETDQTAAPSDEQKAEVRAAIARMNELTVGLEMAYEDLNEAEIKVTELEKAIDTAQKQLDEVQSQLDDAHEDLNTWVRARYRLGDIRYMSVLLGATTFEDFASRVKMMDIITESEIDTIARCEQLSEELEGTRAQLAADQEEVEAQRARAEAAASAVESSLQAQIDYFESLDPEARAAVLAEDGEAMAGASVMGEGGSTSTQGSHPEVASMALTMLGTPYVWGGETTSGFDCSGLVMYCYSHVCGINLAHFARTQYFQGIHIAKTALMPGDLVFFGSSAATIHHVGIYIGDDKFVHAPHTGDVVKVSTLSSRADYVGACRP